jgi:folate-dependent tRNA-U54 methylase TrmFO/GidA
MLGALARYIACADAEGFQPTNAALGLLPEASTAARKKRDRRAARAAAALASLRAWIEAQDDVPVGAAR